MLKSILKKTYLSFNKIKIIHSIPGRIRLFIPFLNKIPKEFRKYESYTISILKLKKGINTVNFSYPTSKILIEYDRNSLTESDIVNWLNEIWKIIIDNEKIYKGMPLNKIEYNMDSFYKTLKNELEVKR